MTGPIYLDHNASTPMDPMVINAMTDAMARFVANPSSSEHAAGAAASAVVEEARTTIAAAVGARTPEIIFCSGSTEANNLALIGAFPNLQKAGKSHIITTSVEHPSVLEPIAYLERKYGVSVTRLPVDETGRISVESVYGAIRSETGLISVMAANNETGICQPIKEIGSLCAEHNVFLHTDYSQATAYCPLNVVSSDVHLASFSGHKMYGPKGVGVLYQRLRKPHVALEPIVYGGGQERGLRSGTLNTPAIVGLACAFKQVKRQGVEDNERISGLRQTLIEKLTANHGIEVNGDLEHALPNTVSVSVEGVEPLALMRLLRNDVTFSASSACSTDRVETSPVLTAMFGDTARARSAFRLGLGRFTTVEDIEIAANALAAGINRLRSGQLGTFSTPSSRQRRA